MPDYSKTKIYKIISNHIDDIYIGSTTLTLSKRMSGHRMTYKHGKNNDSSKLLLKYNDAKIILIENYPCDNNDSKRAREQYNIDLYPCVNKMKSYTGLSKQEYNKGYNKQYKANNRDKISEHNKKYKEKHKERIKNKNKEKVYCIYCDNSTNKQHIKRHNDGYKHIINFINF